MTGASVKLVEFPLAPLTAAPTAAIKPEDLAAPLRPHDPGFEVVLADAMRAPFSGGSFDLMVTPWLLDVIDATPAKLMAEINRLLTSRWPRGCIRAHWLSSAPDPCWRISLDGARRVGG